MDIGKLYCGDNLKYLEDMSEKSVDLIYIDPPFCSGHNYEGLDAKTQEENGFEDTWSEGILQYLEMMEPRIQQIYRILKDTGTFYLHNDFYAVHQLRLICDKIFGEKNFRNEIIWCYAGGGIPKKDFPRKHDNILRYSKSDEYVFNTQYRKYRNLKGRHSHTKYTSTDTPINDWWIDINPVNSMAAIKSYGTQKPEELIARIIQTSSNPRDIVMDCFMGSGTTLYVAKQLGRSFLGIDCNPAACRIAAHRLEIPISQVVGYLMDDIELKNIDWYSFQCWVCDQMNAQVGRKGSDGGADGICFGTGYPIQVKQSGCGRPPIQSFETVMRTVKKKHGAVIAFTFSDDAQNEVIRARREDDLDVKLYKPKDLKRGKQFEDGISAKRMVNTILQFAEKSKRECLDVLLFKQKVNE